MQKVDDQHQVGSGGEEEGSGLEITAECSSIIDSSLSAKPGIDQSGLSSCSTPSPANTLDENELQVSSSSSSSSSQSGGRHKFKSSPKRKKRTMTPLSSSASSDLSLSNDDSANDTTDDDNDDDANMEGSDKLLNVPDPVHESSFLKDYIRLQHDGDGPGFSRHCCGLVEIVRRFELAYKLQGHAGCVNCLHFNPSGTLLASGSDDLKVYIWDWERGKKAFSFETGHESNVFQSKYLPFTDDTYLVTTSRDGQVRLAELSVTGTCRSTKRVAKHCGPANKVALLYQSPRQFISCGEDGLLQLVDLRHPEPNQLVVQREGEMVVGLYSVHANPCNDFYFCTAGRSQSVCIFDRRSVSSPITKLCPEHLTTDLQANITCAVYNFDGSELLASYNKEHVYLFRSADYSSHKHFHGHINSASIKEVNFYGPQSEFVVSGSDCGNFFIWDKKSQSIVNIVPGDENGVVNCVEPHPNLPILAASGLDDNAKIFFPANQNAVDKQQFKKIVMNNAKKLQTHQHIDPELHQLEILWSLFQSIPRMERGQVLESSDSDSGREEANPCPPS